MHNQRLEKISNVISSGSYLDNKEDIFMWLNDEKLGNYFLEKLPKAFESLKRIDFLLERLIIAQNPFFALDLLEKNITEKNNAYIFRFLDKNIQLLLKKDNDSFGNYTVEIVHNILKKFPNETKNSYAFVEKFIQANPKEFSDMRATREHGKQYISELLFDIFEIWKKEGRISEIEKMVKLIGKKFNLIDDAHEFAMFTPEKIFIILYDYINYDFEKNFNEIKKIIIRQFKSKGIGYGKEYDGRDWSSSGISRSNDSFSILDRHFVEKVLAPAVEYFYENAQDKENTWNEVKKLCLTMEKNVSASRPDFLNRALMPVVLDRYMNMRNESKEEAFQILTIFFEMKLLPSKYDLVFQKVMSLGMNESDKWALVNASLNIKWNKKKLPVNVFVEQIITQIAKEGEKRDEARQLLDMWIRNEDYLESQSRGGYNLLGIISNLLSVENKNEGIELFEKYIFSDAFRSKQERFDAFDVASKMTLILELDFEKGIDILQKIFYRDGLTENEQILICSGLEKISKPDVRIRAYNEFLKKVFEYLDSDIEKIVEKFSYDYPRTAIVEFGDELAKDGKFAEALEIANIFIDDPDPRNNNKEGNLHNEIVNGKDVHSITTTRGWVCWLLHEFPVLSGREFIPKIVPLVEKLSVDENYYVRSQACFPMAELMRVRNTVLPDNVDGQKVWFLDRDVAAEIESIALNMLRSQENQQLKAVMINIAHVFSYMRSMNTELAMEVLNIFKNCKYSEPIEKVDSLFVFYAEFRKNAFKGDLWKDLEDFDDLPVKELLKDFLITGNKKARINFLWQFMHLVGESEKNKTLEYSDAFKIAYDYISILAVRYESEIYTHIYRFIEDNIGNEYEKCTRLFLICLTNERVALNSGEIDKTWISLMYHREILGEIYNKNDKELFLNALYIVSDYPDKYLHREELKGTLNYLVEYPINNKDVERIFDKLIKKNPAYYDAKLEWQNKNMLRNK